MALRWRYACCAFLALGVVNLVRRIPDSRMVYRIGISGSAGLAYRCPLPASGTLVASNILSMFGEGMYSVLNFQYIILIPSVLPRLVQCRP